MDKVLSLLGLAAKGRNLVSGEFSTEKAVKGRKAFLVVVASDASDNTKKHFTDMCAFYGTPIRFYADKEELGRAIGKEMRSSLAVTEPGLSGSLLSYLTKTQE